MLRVGELFRRTAQGDVLNVMGAIFVSAMFLGTSNSSTVQPVFAIERSVMYRCASHQHPALSFVNDILSIVLSHRLALAPSVASGDMHVEGITGLKDADACMLWPGRGWLGCMR